MEQNDTLGTTDTILPERDIHEFRDILFTGIPGEIRAEDVDYRGVSLEGMGKGISLNGEAGIGEDLVDSLIATIGWAGKQICRGNGFFPLIFLEESGWSP